MQARTHRDVASRQSRDEEASKIAFTRLYHAIMRRVAFPKMPDGGFDCFLLDRRVIAQVLDLEDSNAWLTGLVLWTGFSFAEVGYDRLRRPHGSSRWTLGKKLKLVVDSVVGFSYAPVRAMSLVGTLIGLTGFAYALLIALRRVVYGEDIVGWSSLMAAIMCLRRSHRPRHPRRIRLAHSTPPAGGELHRRRDAQPRGEPSARHTTKRRHNEAGVVVAVSWRSSGERRTRRRHQHAGRLEQPIVHRAVRVDERAMRSSSSVRDRGAGWWAWASTPGLRELAGLSQEQLARLAGVSQEP